MSATNTSYVKIIRSKPRKSAATGFKQHGHSGIAKHNWTRSNSLKFKLEQF